MTDQMRAHLLQPTIKRWRAGLGLAGAEAIEDGEPLSPQEQEALRRMQDAITASARQIAEQVEVGVRAMTRIATAYVEAHRPIVDRMLQVMATPEWQRAADHLKRQIAYNDRMRRQVREKPRAKRRRRR